MDAITLKDIISSAGYEPRSYSGRGMYGKECVGFTVDRDTGMLRAIMDLIDCVDLGTATDMVGDDLYSLTSAIRSAATDSMGLDMIIYFPRVEWKEDD